MDSKYEITVLAGTIGAAVGGVISLVGVFLSSWVTERRERRQQVWQQEVARIIDLEERAGQLVEVIGSHCSPEVIGERANELLLQLETDAGRFRRHKDVAQAIRDLHNGLSRLFDDKLHHRDYRDVASEVEGFYAKLTKECDRVTGERRI